MNPLKWTKTDHPVRVITTYFSHQSIVDPDDPIDCPHDKCPFIVTVSLESGKGRPKEAIQEKEREIWIADRRTG